MGQKKTEEEIIQEMVNFTDSLNDNPEPEVVPHVDVTATNLSTNLRIINQVGRSFESVINTVSTKTVVSDNAYNAGEFQFVVQTSGKCSTPLNLDECNQAVSVIQARGTKSSVSFRHVELKPSTHNAYYLNVHQAGVTNGSGETLMKSHSRSCKSIYFAFSGSK